MTKKILVTRQYPESGIRRLEKAGFKLTLWDKKDPMTQDELIEKSKDHNAILCTLTEKIDSRFLSACGHLDMISQFAVGYDNIDVGLATEMGIPVGHTPGVLTDATADLAFALILAVSRKIVFQHKLILKGEWGSFDPVGHLGFELKNKTLGILGLGRIGMKLAEYCRAAYGMKIIYTNRSRNDIAEEKLGATFVGFDELLEKSDIISAHCALTSETKEIFNYGAFKKMKPTAVFINTARGGVHREADLIQALKDGEIWGAGLDVTNPEPMLPDNPLLEMENVCVLPHIGSGTIEARQAMSELAANNLIEFYQSGRVPHIVNPEVLK